MKNFAAFNVLPLKKAGNKPAIAGCGVKAQWVLRSQLWRKTSGRSHYPATANSLRQTNVLSAQPAIAQRYPSDSPAMGESLPAASGMSALAEMGMESVRFSALDSV